MRLQKKTKIALLMLLISSILFTVVLIIFAKPADYDKSAQTVQYEEPVPEITVTPEPTAAPEEENEEDQEKTEETKGLTNGRDITKRLLSRKAKTFF